MNGVDRALRVGKKMLGEENTKIMPYAAMGGEDFAFIKEKKPGIFVRLGARTPGGPYGSAHSPTFYCDNACLPVGMLTIIGLAARLSRLRRLILPHLTKQQRRQAVPWRRFAFTPIRQSVT